MYHEHFSKLLSEMVEIMSYSSGAVTYSDVENMYVDELHYFIYNFKKIYEAKEAQKQELIKSIMEYANNVISSLGKSLSSLFKLK